MKGGLEEPLRVGEVKIIRTNSSGAQTGQVSAEKGEGFPLWIKGEHQGEKILNGRRAGQIEKRAKSDWCEGSG